ncbi:CIS tube protein [Tenacibaculum sp. ZS6-P6]|uniref:CIS tube protein n=1 Tax=Tenacibaculum sp. ZS6-P6 TaxID=3447503 RepID=UPI003F94391A
MGLEHMKIAGYYDGDFTNPIPGDPYKVMINPNTIKWNRKIIYNKQRPIDASKASQKYKNSGIDDLSFDIVIDCTGVVFSKRVDMATEIKTLEDIVYKYDGKIHRPNFVKVQWGSNISFKGVLKTFNTTYTLFKPDGSPLRAKVSLSFEEYVSPKKKCKVEKKESPDITHLVEVVEGESLPQLCNKVWNNPLYYVQVANYNGLNKFRNLKGGQELIFPPIIKS